LGGKVSIQDYWVLKAISGPGFPVKRNYDRRLPLPEGAISDLLHVFDHLDGIRTVSLDLFDTLVRRVIDPPDRGQTACLFYLSNALVRLGVDASIKDLLSLRSEAEAHARQRAQEAHGEAECTLSEILVALFGLVSLRFGVDQSVLPSIDYLIEIELRHEAKLLSAMPSSAPLLKGLNDRGIDVIVISDMYLEKAHLERLLGNLGLSRFIKDIFVSSSLRRSKGSGSLYKHLIQCGRVVPAATLHIGDHVVSDFLKPKEYGLKSLLYQNYDEQIRRASVRDAVLASELFGDLDAFESFHGHPHAAAHGGPSPYTVGFGRFGLVFTLFALDVFRAAISGRYRKIFFLSRDGFIFHELFCRIKDKFGLFVGSHDVPYSYLMLSRASTLAAMSSSVSELLSLASRVNGGSPLEAMISSLGIPLRPFQDLLHAEYPGCMAEQLTQEQFMIFIGSDQFQQLLTDEVDKAQGALELYLRQNDFFGDGRILLVDIGWQGTIPRALEKRFGAHRDFPCIDVMYFGRLAKVSMKDSKVRFLEGFAFDEDRFNPVEHCVNLCRELFEGFASETCGSTLGYLLEDGIATPKLGDSGLSVSEAELIRDMQRGIVDYSDYFCSIFGLHFPDPAALRAGAITRVVALINSYCPGETEIISRLPIDLSWGKANRGVLGDLLVRGPNDNATLQFDLGALNPLPSDSAGGNLSGQKFFETIHRITSLLKLKKTLVVYGAGTVSAVLGPILINQIAFFIDANPELQLSGFLGKPVYPPNEISRIPHDAHVFVSVINRRSVISPRLSHFLSRVTFVDDFFDLRL
jgi:FMN phosphatase YigB (HAD superfamily)